MKKRERNVIEATPMSSEVTLLGVTLRDRIQNEKMRQLLQAENVET